jgi:hypothetical protein
VKARFVALVLAFSAATAAITCHAQPSVQSDECTFDRNGYYKNRDETDVHQPAKCLNGQVPEGRHSAM